MSRPATSMRRLSGRGGFSLVEVMTASFITVVLTLGMVRFLIQQQAIHKAQRQMTEIRQNTGFAVDLISSDIRMAGYGLKVPEEELDAWVIWISGFDRNPMLHDGANGAPDGMIIRPNATIDGHFIIGELANGDTGDYPTSHYVEEIDRIPQDPLGAAAGTVADLIVAARTQNDNGLVPAISGTMLDLVNHVTATIPSGDYYLTDIDIGNHSVLNVDASSGPVILFLEGGFKSSPGCEINVLGDPKDFRIFSNVNELIVVQPNTAFKAFIYAPFAEIRILPGANYYGIIWGRMVDLHPGGDIYIDLSMLETMYANRITIDSWKEVRR